MKRSAAFATALVLTTLSHNALAASSNASVDNWRMGMIGPGTLSLKASQLADEKASNQKVKQFAKFETSEQNALGSILKELGTAEPEMTDEDMATMKKLEDAPKGKVFDKAYIKMQIMGHEKLGKINSSFLNASSMSDDQQQNEARHLSMFIKPAIEQHIANTKEIDGMLK